MGGALQRLIARIVGATATPPQASGALAETRAAEFLKTRGCHLIARNVLCRGGEIDLIVRDRDAIVFVEVRLRQREAFGGAAASITPAKQARLRHAARTWLAGAGRRHAARPCRFDAVLFDAPDQAEPAWLRGAFDDIG